MHGTVCTIFLLGGEDVAKYQNWLDPEALLLIEAWSRDGLTDEQIARNMGIATSTLYNWKNEHLEILEALKKGKEVVDIQVENALLKRALGYTYKETTSECGENGELKVTKVVTKEVVPDTTAQIFWLKTAVPTCGVISRTLSIADRSTIRLPICQRKNCESWLMPNDKA